MRSERRSLPIFPATLQELDAERHYVGGPGDMITLLRFNADADVVAALIRSSGATPDDEADTYLPWATAADRRWKTAVGIAERWWPVAPSLRDPVLYSKFSMSAEGVPSSLTILWDRASGDVHAVFSTG